MVWNKVEENGITGAGSSTESYGYGAGGERLSKTNSGVTAKYVYDTSGHLLAEASAGSSTTREYIYLGDRLMGEYDVAAKKLYSVHTDRMGTPFLLTDKTKAVQWSGVSEPYGRVASSSGSVAQNVRLPGQYDDGAGLYHNGFRDYSPGSLKDPRVGVYLESDPIRLAGGLNVYAYVGGKPTRYVDPMGLKVEMCCRKAEIAGGLVNHCWVKTDTKSAGMASSPMCRSNVGDTYEFIYLTSVYISDHSCEKADACMEVKDIDEDCVNKRLDIGKSLGTFSFANECQMFANSTIYECSKK